MKVLKNKLRHFDKLRRKYTHVLEQWLYNRLNNTSSLNHHLLTPDQVKTVLVLRNNKRIGNMYFMLPFIHALKAAYPSANIDLMVNKPSQIQVFDNLGLTQIFASQFSFKAFINYAKLMLRLRKNTYDMIIMPYRSTTDTITAAILSGKNKIAFAHDLHASIFNHSVKMPNRHPHLALSSLALLTQLGHPTITTNAQLQLTKKERQHGKYEIGNLTQYGQLCITFFRGARGKKIISDLAWRKIMIEFEHASDKNIKWIEILSPDISTPLLAGGATYQTANLRHLGATLACSDLFICGDTGPLHLANASGAQCVGLFNHTSPLIYGCLNPNNLNITHINNLNAESILKHFQLTLSQPNLKKAG
ncbi:glycosyltransferase family 9 protein [Vibrio sp. S17_S38]|uniref:glycosyltransferase family 9 protein n=1 Tax=Vibrio sp. S17_S38 TaxID=2720229 RepID=UPI001681471D|nr:glycosyltransferase family 9 protein [Vibrio sp. S17_S38]MBD1574807.1 glycosyltransferase family 9 protein [Vibrio sp. S17_S38]